MYNDLRKMRIFRVCARGFVSTSLKFGFPLESLFGNAVELAPKD